MSVNVQCLKKDPAMTILFLSRLRDLLEQHLEEAKLSKGELNVVIADDQLLKRLNRKYRDKDAPTDVLSFSYLDSADQDSLTGDEFAVGDIYISIDRAGEQAKLSGHNLKRELALLAVHGLLHLLGYEHNGDNQAKKMREKERTIMDEFDKYLVGEQ